MYCTPDCTCSLCRELRGFRPKLVLIDRPPISHVDDTSSSRAHQPTPSVNDNFILRRRRLSEFDYDYRNSRPSINALRATASAATPISNTSTERLLSCSIGNLVDAQSMTTTLTNNKINDCEPRFEAARKTAAATTITKSRSCSDVWRRPDLQSHQPPVKRLDQQHKVVIYFGDSLSSKQQLQQAAESAFREPVKVKPMCDGNDEIIKQLQHVLVEKNRGSSEFSKPASIAATMAGQDDTGVTVSNEMKTQEEYAVESQELPSFVESVANGVINIKIEGSFQSAIGIVDSVVNGHDENEISTQQHSENSFDWSFVQDWRSRPSGNSRVDLSQQFNKQLKTTPIDSAQCSPPSPTHPASSHHLSTQIACSGAPMLSTHHVPSLGRIQSPAVATPATRISKEVAYRPPNEQRAIPLKLTQPNAKSMATAVVSPQHQSRSNHNQAFNQLSQSHDDVRAQPAANVKASALTETATFLHNGVNNMMIPERDTEPTTSLEPQTPAHSKPLPHRPMSGPAKLTIQSIPVKSQPPMLSTGLSRQPKAANPLSKHADISLPVKAQTPIKALPTPHHTQITHHTQVIQNQQHLLASAKSPPITTTTTPIRTHHHGGSYEFRGLHRVNECHSSSDENRSSGHASMSDTGHGSSSPAGHRSNEHLGTLPEERLAAGVTNRISGRSRTSTNGQSRPRQRGTPAKVPWAGGGLEDIKLAIQQLTMRSQTSNSTYSSLSAGSESSEPARRLGRYSSLETVNTNVTSADEFVWVDSHNRLVELQHPPWSQHCVMRVIRGGRCREHSERISNEVIPRLGYLLQRALVRTAREVQRLSCGLGLCSKHEVGGAFKIVLCPAIADSCIKACLRAAAMFAVPGDSSLRQSKSARAGLQLPVGRFHRWMADARLGRFVHEYAAVYMTAGLENLLEEIILQCLSADTTQPLTATGLEHAIAASGDLWGLLQPYAHLNAGRIASGALTMPRWTSQTSVGSPSGTPSSMEPCLLTTCVGSIAELRDLVLRAQNKFHNAAISHAALIALYYFMRCSQLEHCETSSSVNGGNSNSIQELCYERAYVVLPPLVEWLRVATAHAEYRHSVLIDKDDILQSARLLLPGVDCPPRPVSMEEELPSKKTIPSMVSPSAVGSLPDDIHECGRRATLALAFRLMLSGRPELMMQASSLLPAATRYDTLNQLGMSALMVAVIRNDEQAIQMLLDVGADPNVEVPTVGATGNASAIHPETQQWTAVTFAACRGSYGVVRILLERGGQVEGGARLSEDNCTLTPLQVASGSGCLDVVSLLLAHGAHAFLSTQQKDSLCFSGTAQRGCYSAISVAAAHGQRVSLRKLLTHPLAPGNSEVLSLEEMLAEGDSGGSRTTVTGAGNGADRSFEPTTSPPSLNKTQIKCLQEAMYHSAENNHLDITVELRALGVPWTLHCWMHALAAAHELRLDAVIDQLLQDFLQVCPDDYSSQFVTECLPLLFNIFRYSKKEGTTLLLADIFATCFGWETIKHIKEPVLQPVNGSRIDPKFVNNPELSDVMFKVEGKIFYGHKIVLVTASSRFQSMLSSKLSDGNTPTVQINDIRYHIFQLVMQFLYNGGCNTLDVVAGDVLELMAAASFFQLDGLLRYTESRCSQMIDIDNVVAMYIHAKVYNAPKLMEYCQGFLIQNMVALLTYDDSVKRLLFAKKIPNHDVLSGLLATLQTRIKQRRAAPNTSLAASGAVGASGGHVMVSGMAGSRSAINIANAGAVNKQ